MRISTLPYLLIVLLTGCSFFKGAQKVDDKIKEGKALVAQNAFEKKYNALTEDFNNLKGTKSDSSKISPFLAGIFYIFGAIGLIGGIAVAIIFKMRIEGGALAACGVSLLIIPFFIDVLYVLEGPIAIGIGILFFIVIVCAIALVLVKFRRILKDMANHEEEDILKQTSLLRDKLRNKEIKNAG